MKVLITGHKGFIGSHLWKRLKEEGYGLRGFDAEEGYYIVDPPFGAEYPDLRQKTVKTVFQDFKPDVVVHLAAQAYIEPGEKEPVQNAITNVAGTVNVLENARKVGAKVVFTSSGAVYGNVLRIPVHEEVTCLPESHYGMSKLAAEAYAKFYNQKHGVPITITRFSSVYGPGRQAGPINLMCARVVKGEPVIITGDGSVTRDLTYISDVIEGLKMCIDGKIPLGSTYNIASGTQTSMMAIVRTIEKEMECGIDIDYRPEVPRDILINYFDIEKARRYGYTPRVMLEEGIRKVINHLKGETET